jgi:hypothetical protein
MGGSESVFRFAPPQAHTSAVRPELYRLARQQNGLVTLAQFQVVAGRSAWQRAHRSGVLMAVHCGVSRLVDGTPSPAQAIAAAVLVTNGIASHLTPRC